MCSREDRSQAHDAGEFTVGYLVIIYNYVTAITYRCLVMGLGRNTPPPRHVGRSGSHISDGSTLGSRVQFHTDFPPINHPCTGNQL